MNTRLLLVDDDAAVREALAFSLSDQGYDVTTAPGGREALIVVESAPAFDVILTDLRMPGMSGMELLRALRERHVKTPVVVVTAYGSVDGAVLALREGAADFVEKPVSRETLKLTLDRVLLKEALVEENAALKAEIAAVRDDEGFVAVSESARAVLALIDRVAESDATVLLLGASGTGKELLARRLHTRSSRRAKPFVAINCSALPKELLEAELFGFEKGAFTGALRAKKGRFVVAHGGTLFLDEIGDLDKDLQAKLLRVLQERMVDVVGGSTVPIDVRIVAATHQDLMARVKDGRFREDLYYRLHVVPVVIPPLDARRDDIAPLFAVLLKRSARAFGVAVPPVESALISALSARAWPGNVRELENFTVRLLAEHAGQTLTRAMLDVIDAPVVSRANDATGAPEVDARAHHLRLPDEGLSLAGLERAAIVAALRKSAGNQSQAARFLRVARHVLLYRVDKFRINESEWRGHDPTPSAPILDVDDDGGDR
jgi:DNA-binding NtrC family response regulator